MPAARGVKRSASKASASTASTAPTSKKKRATAIQLEIPSPLKRCGRVLACGQGDVGQLGLGEDVMETMRFKHVKDLGDQIVSIVAGGMHTITLDKSGQVWSFGCNDEGALGRSGAEALPARVPLPDAAVAISAGDSHSAALLSNGDVYAWGAFRDSHGSMGLVVRGREGKACMEPVKIDIGETAAEIASGGDHLLILSTLGGVWSLGTGEQGQLGRVAPRSCSRHARAGPGALLAPGKVPLRRPCSRVWAGSHASFAYDATRSMLMAWGLNNYGQLGITGESRKSAVYAPLECDAFNSRLQPDEAEWQQIVCGQHHTLARDSRGVVYCIGRCEYGRLGLGDREGDAVNLEAIPKLEGKKCISIGAGTSNSFAVTQCGSVLAWGMGSEGQLGTGRDEDCREPTLANSKDMEALVPLAVSCGGQHTVILLEDPNAKNEAPTSQSQPQSVQEKPQQSKRTNKRQKKNSEQEEQVSSTSASAQDVPTTAKVNGDEQIETPMETDETGKPQDNKDEPSDTTTETKTDVQSETDKQDDITDATDKVTDKQDITDKSDVKETTDLKEKSDVLEQNDDVDMKEVKEAELNGTPDKIETKPVKASRNSTEVTTEA